MNIWLRMLTLIEVSVSHVTSQRVDLTRVSTRFLKSGAGKRVNDWLFPHLCADCLTKENNMLHLCPSKSKERLSDFFVRPL